MTYIMPKKTENAPPTKCYLDLIKQGYAGADLNVRAEYEAKIVPRLAEAGISYSRFIKNN